MERIEEGGGGGGVLETSPDVGISTSTKIADGGGREERRRDQRRRFVGEEKGRRRRSQWGKGSRGEMSGMGNELEKSKG